MAPPAINKWAIDVDVDDDDDLNYNGYFDTDNEDVSSNLDSSKPLNLAGSRAAKVPSPELRHHFDHPATVSSSYGEVEPRAENRSCQQRRGPPMPVMLQANSGQQLAAFFGFEFYFSNFYPCRPKFELDGHLWSSSEHYYVYKKLLHFDESEKAQLVRMNPYNWGPAKMKKMGREVEDDANAADVNKWAQVKPRVMGRALMAKYGQSDLLRFVLFGTDNAELVEASPYDPFWGAGVGLNEPDRLTDTVRWRFEGGRNMMGITLMLTRDQLRRELEEKKALSQGLVFRTSTSMVCTYGRPAARTSANTRVVEMEVKHTSDRRMKEETVEENPLQDYLRSIGANSPSCVSQKTKKTTERVGLSKHHWAVDGAEDFTEDLLLPTSPSFYSGEQERRLAKRVNAAYTQQESWRF